MAARQGGTQVNEWTKVAVKHPVGWTLGSAAFLAIFLAAVGRPPFAALAAGCALAALNWFLWRPGGSQRRRNEELDTSVINWRRIALSVGFMLVLSALTVLLIALVQT